MKGLEDFSVGQRFDLGPYRVGAQEIIDFAVQFDPQLFHTEQSHERTLAVGGLMASGWHTTAIFMRMAVDAYMGETATLTSPGVDQVRWLAPVRPDDVLSGVTEVTVARASASKPDRGIVKADVRIWNQNAIDVLTLTTTTFVMTRSGVAELDGSV